MGNSSDDIDPTVGPDINTIKLTELWPRIASRHRDRVYTLEAKDLDWQTGHHGIQAGIASWPTAEHTQE